MMWLDFGPRHTPETLLKHLERTGIEVPQWLLDEPEMQFLDHSMSKGTRCVLIYRAMLWDGRAAYLTPTGHTADCEYHCEQYPHECTCGATQARTIPVQPSSVATDEGVVERVVREAAEPWADYHGDLPDYDHPLRPVYESGIQYTVELLAKVLGVEDYEICDGTEEFDGDLGGTLLNIVIKTWPTDEHGDWIDLRNAEARAAIHKGVGDHD